jgi:hypothetical protein
LRKAQGYLQPIIPISGKVLRAGDGLRAKYRTSSRRLKAGDKLDFDAPARRRGDQRTSNRTAGPSGVNDAQIVEVCQDGEAASGERRHV